MIANHDPKAIDRIAVGVLGLLAVVAALTFRDYGLGWDDYTHSQYAELLLSFYTSGFKDQRAFSFINLYYYGGGFDVAALLLSGSPAATPAQVKRAASIAFALAFAGGIFLVWAGGWPILAIGLASLAAGWAYSGGPRPLSHTAFGEVFVLAFFGVAASAGSHYLQSAAWAPSAVVLGLALGLQAAAVLLVNNVRDLEADRLAGRRTLAAALGLARSRGLYAVLMLAPFALVAWLAWQLGAAIVLLASLPALAWCVVLALGFAKLPPGAQMNRQLARTAQAQVLLGALLSAAMLV